MQGIDVIIQVNPKLAHCGLAMVFNPTLIAVNENFTVPLYYTGITTTAKISKEGATPVVYQLDKDFSVQLELNMPPMSFTWFVVENDD